MDTRYQVALGEDWPWFKDRLKEWDVGQRPNWIKSILYNVGIGSDRAAQAFCKDVHRIWQQCQQFFPGKGTAAEAASRFAQLAKRRVALERMQAVLGDDWPWLRDRLKEWDLGQRPSWIKSILYKINIGSDRAAQAFCKDVHQIWRRCQKYTPGDGAAAEAASRFAQLAERQLMFERMQVALGDSWPWFKDRFLEYDVSQWPSWIKFIHQKLNSGSDRAAQALCKDVHRIWQHCQQYIPGEGAAAAAASKFAKLAQHQLASVRMQAALGDDWPWLRDRLKERAAGKRPSWTKFIVHKFNSGSDRAAQAFCKDVRQIWQQCQQHNPGDGMAAEAASRFHQLAQDRLVLETSKPVPLTELSVDEEMEALRGWQEEEVPRGELEEEVLPRGEQEGALHDGGRLATCGNLAKRSWSRAPSAAGDGIGGDGGAAGNTPERQAHAAATVGDGGLGGGGGVSSEGGPTVRIKQPKRRCTVGAAEAAAGGDEGGVAGSLLPSAAQCPGPPGTAAATATATITAAAAAGCRLVTPGGDLPGGEPGMHRAAVVVQELQQLATQIGTAASAGAQATAQPVLHGPSQLLREMQQEVERLQKRMGRQEQEVGRLEQKAADVEEREQEACTARLAAEEREQEACTARQAAEEQVQEACVARQAAEEREQEACTARQAEEAAGRKAADERLRAMQTFFFDQLWVMRARWAGLAYWGGGHYPGLNATLEALAMDLERAQAGLLAQPEAL